MKSQGSKQKVELKVKKIVLVSDSIDSFSNFTRLYPFWPLLLPSLFGLYIQTNVA